MVSSFFQQATAWHPFCVHFAWGMRFGLVPEAPNPTPNLDGLGASLGCFGAKLDKSYSPPLSRQIMALSIL